MPLTTASSSTPSPHRSTFGGTTSDFAAETVAGGFYKALPGRRVTFWDSPVGGSRHVDLLVDGVEVGEIIAGVRGRLPHFQGPLGVTFMWADAGEGDRYRVIASGDHADIVSAAAASATQASTSAAGSATDAEAAAQSILGIDTPDETVALLVEQEGALTRDAILSLVTEDPGSRLNAREYGATGDGVTDDWAALDAWLTAVIDQRKVGYLPAGIYRITASLARPDCPVPVAIAGDGRAQTYFYGDFVNAGAAMLDFSGTNHSTGKHSIHGLGFLGNGKPGDPEGLRLYDAWLCNVSDISAPGSVYIPNAPNRDGQTALANSVLVVTNDNNSTFRGIHSQGGWQPYAFSGPLDTTVSFSPASRTITATSTAFFTATVGKTIYFNSGSANGSNQAWKAVITAVVGSSPSTQVTIDRDPPSTGSGVKVGVAHVWGDTAADSNQLALAHVAWGPGGASAPYIGMQIHVLGAALKENGSAGVLSTHITAINGFNITMAAPATLAVDNAPVLFAPALFVGEFEEGNTPNQQPNHSWWSDVHLEGFSACGIIVNNALYVDFDRLKLHGAAFASAVDWATCLYAGVFSEIKDCTVRAVQSDYGVLGPKIHVSGSRGLLRIDSFEVGQSWPDSPPIQIGSNADSFRLVLGDVFFLYALTGFPADYAVTARASMRYVESRGIVHRRQIANTVTMTPPMVTGGATGQHGTVVVADSSVMKWKPAGNFGILHVVSGEVGVGGIVAYRTSDDSAGALLQSFAELVNFDVITSPTTLAGTTGAGGQVTVAADSSGNLQLENRRGFNVRVTLWHAPFGR